MKLLAIKMLFIRANEKGLQVQNRKTLVYSAPSVGLKPTTL